MALSQLPSPRVRMTIATFEVSTLPYPVSYPVSTSVHNNTVNYSTSVLHSWMHEMITKVDVLSLVAVVVQGLSAVAIKTVV